VRRWLGGDRVLLRLTDGSIVSGRVLQPPREWRDGVAVMVECDDGMRRFVEPARLSPALRLVHGGSA
jgi:hypothetical protein